MLVSPAFAQTGGASGLFGGLDQLQQFLPLVLIFVVFYFLLIRPQSQKAKKHREMVAALRRGDRVLTQGGIFGTVVKVINEAEVQVEVAEGVRVRVARSAVSEVLAKTEPAAGTGGDKPAKGDGESSGEGGSDPAPKVKPEGGLGGLLSRLLGPR